jgi:hypothetical protein
MEREEHVMIQTRSLRGLAVALFLACAAMAAVPAAQADPTGAQSQLTAVTGQGVGKVIVSPTSANVDTFVAQVKVNIHDAAPNTTFTVTRTIDAPPADGVCTSTDFVTVGTLTTSAGGAGAAEFKRAGPLLDFDLFLRVIGSDGTVLQSRCMIIIGK